MKRESFIFIILGLALVALGYGIAYDLATAQQSTSTPSTTSTSSRLEAIARIIDVNNGRVARKRVNAQAYQLVAINAELFAGDLILPEGNAVVLVQCNESGAVWRVPAGSPSGVSSGCASPDRFNFGAR